MEGGDRFSEAALTHFNRSSLDDTRTFPRNSLRSLVLFHPGFVSIHNLRDTN